MPFSEITLDDGSALETISYQVINEKTVTFDLAITTDSTVTATYTIVYVLETTDLTTEIVYAYDDFKSCGQNACLYLNTDDEIRLTVYIAAFQADIALTLYAYCLYNGVQSIESISVSFVLTIIPCELYSVTADSPDLTYYYTLGTRPAIFALSEYTQDPSCTYAISKITPVFYEPIYNDYLDDFSINVIIGIGLVVSVDQIDELEN